MSSIVDMGNFKFYWSWTPRITPRSSATHAPGSGLISTDTARAQIAKIANFTKKLLQLKGLNVRFLFLAYSIHEYS